MKKNVILNRILIIVLCVIIGFLSILCSPNTTVQANEKITYDESNVLDDLQGATIGGKAFDTADYPFNSAGKTQVIYFSEFCYSYDSSRQDDYALYVYVYNPKGLAFDNNEKNNTIAFACGENENYNIYSLKFLNYSVKQGYEGRFYKYKVNMTEAQKANVLSNINTDERVYKISEIELAINGKVENNTVLSTYKYKGYSLGYGSSVMTESSLSCIVDGFDKYVRVQVDSTYYRPEGTNGKEHTQDSLHSVYFPVENNIINEFGEITGATATFFDALLKPALVVGDYNIYKEYYDLLGVDVSSLDTCNLACLSNDHITLTSKDSFDSTEFKTFFAEYIEFNPVISFAYNFWMCPETTLNSLFERVINPLYLLFYASDASVFNEENVEAVSAKAVENKILELTELYGDKAVMDRYSSKLFDYVSEERTLLKIDKQKVNGQTLDLVKQTISYDNWWKKLWGNETVRTETFDNIPPLEAVNYNDLDLSDEELSYKYKIALADIGDFRETCIASKEDNKTVYCLRYRVTDYTSVDMAFWEQDYDFLGGEHLTKQSSDVFAFQMYCDLGFQIIDLTFTKDDVSTILPVLMKPQDIFHGATTPIDIEDNSGCAFYSWLAWGIFVLGLVILALIVFITIKLSVNIANSNNNVAVKVFLYILMAIGVCLMIFVLSFFVKAISCLGGLVSL